MRNTVTGRSHRPDISANKADDCEEKSTIARDFELCLCAKRRELHAHKQFALRPRILLSPEIDGSTAFYIASRVIVLHRARSSHPATFVITPFYRKKCDRTNDILLRERYFTSRFVFCSRRLRTINRTRDATPMNIHLLWYDNSYIANASPIFMGLEESSLFHWYCTETRAYRYQLCVKIGSAEKCKISNCSVIYPRHLCIVMLVFVLTV